MGGRQALLQAGNQQLRQSLRADRRVVPPGPSARGHPRPRPCTSQSALTFLSSRWASSNVKLWEFYRETQRLRKHRCTRAGPRLRGWGPEAGCHSEQEPPTPIHLSLGSAPRLSPQQCPADSATLRTTLPPAIRSPQAATRVPHPAPPPPRASHVRGVRSPPGCTRTEPA